MTLTFAPLPALLCVALIAGVTGCTSPKAASNDASQQVSTRPAAQSTDSGQPESVPLAAPQEVRIAAAADLVYAFKELQTIFESEHPGVSLSLTFGSSGKMFAQLQQEAPFDLFFAADANYPMRLVESGHAVRESYGLYARGQIALWVRNDFPLSVEEKKQQILLEPTVRKIAIANPEHAPYGKAAEAAFETWGIKEQVQDRLVFGDNIAQTAQFAESGAAEVGVISLSIAVSETMRNAGRYWTIPLEDYPPINQGCVMMKWAKAPEAAMQFLEYLEGPRGQAIMQNYGFLSPTE